MYIDLSVLVTPKVQDYIGELEKMALVGHMGTHFDCMDSTFPLEYVCCDGLVVEVSHITDREIEPEDLPIACLKPGQFVLFHTGADQYEYGTKEYAAQKPALSHRCIDFLLEKHVALIGIDATGIRHGSEHLVADRKCAAQNVFVVENVINLPKILNGQPFAFCTVYTAPTNFSDCSGIPCRVIAKV